MIRKTPSPLCFIYLALPLLFLACAGSGIANNQPDWVRDPYIKYDRQANFAAVGDGSSREAAEKSALGNLVAIFGQNIKVDEKVVVSYQQAVRNGVAANWSENTAVDSMISISAGFDSLVGAEIGDTWNDGKGYFAAVVVLNKANAIRIYPDIIKSNQTMIDNLVNIPATEQNTLEGYARYQLAATVADMTIPYANLLSVIDGPPQVVKSGEDYRLKALDIAKAIPVALRVRNDMAGRIEGAFAKALSDLGFQSGGNDSRYALDVNIITTAVEFPNDERKWTRINVTANLVDSNSGTVLFPCNFSPPREGHTTQALADNRAYMAAEQRINDEYARLLSAYLNQLLPQIQP